MRSVHYLCRKPGSVGELVYPLELPDGYQSLGSFFLGGSDVSSVDEVYRFPVYLDGSVLPSELRHIRGAIFEAEIQAIGRFAFRAIQAGMPARYTGAYPFDDIKLVRQLAPRNRAFLEEVALTKDFMFVGYSPRIDDATPLPPAPTGPAPPAPPVAGEAAFSRR